MYTVLWQEDEQDRWERLETRDDVLILLTGLKDNPDVCEEDIMIFTPGADDYSSNCAGFVRMGEF